MMVISFRDMNKMYLLDTHIFIWWMTNSSNLSPKVRALIADPESEMYLSLATIWEMTIKLGNNKLQLPVDWRKTLEKSNFVILPIKLKHIFDLGKLPRIHKDPFDRMLVAQAISENMILITDDEKIRSYKVRLIA